jgi:hypothetical protein
VIPFSFVTTNALLLDESSCRSEELNDESLDIDTLLFGKSFLSKI